MEAGNVTRAANSSYCPEVFINNSMYVNLNVILIAINAPFALFTVVSNALIIGIVAVSKNLHTTPNALLCSLAFTDLMTGLGTQPLMIAWRVLIQEIQTTCIGKSVHLFYEAFLFIWTGGSFANLAFISYDRLLAVSQPLRYSSRSTTRKVMRRLSIIWVSWIALVVMKYVVFTEEVNYIITTAIACLLLGFLIFTQIATIVYIKKNNTKILTQHNEKIVYEREKRATFTVMAVFITLILFLLPAVFIGRLHKNGKPMALHFAISVMLINSSANPLIYLWRSREIRANFVRYLTCSKEKRSAEEELQKRNSSYTNQTVTQSM